MRAYSGSHPIGSRPTVTEVENIRKTRLWMVHMMLSRAVMKHPVGPYLQGLGKAAVRQGSLEALLPDYDVFFIN